jgi:hypothetical protein
MLQVAYLTKHCSQPLCIPAYIYEVRPRKDKRGVDLISNVLAFGRLWLGWMRSTIQSVT